MKVQFKVPRSVGGKDYSKGIHTVPDNIEKDWYFKALIKSGSAVILDAVVAKVSTKSRMAPKPKPVEAEVSQG